jgi:hypothetical protein
VRELRGTAPELSERAALRALELCGGREDDAILRVTEEPAFKRRCMADAGDFGGCMAQPPCHAKQGLLSAGSRARPRRPRSGVIAAAADTPRPPVPSPAPAAPRAVPRPAAAGAGPAPAGDGPISKLFGAAAAAGGDGGSIFCGRFRSKMGSYEVSGSGA